MRTILILIDLFIEDSFTSCFKLSSGLSSTLLEDNFSYDDRSCSFRSLKMSNMPCKIMLITNLYFGMHSRVLCTYIYTWILSIRYVVPFCHGT